MRNPVSLEILEHLANDAELVKYLDLPARGTDVEELMIDQLFALSAEKGTPLIRHQNWDEQATHIVMEACGLPVGKVTYVGNRTWYLVITEQMFDLLIQAVCLDN